MFVAGPEKYPDELRGRAVRLCRESDPKPTVRRLGERLEVHPGRCGTGFAGTRSTVGGGTTGR